MAAKTRRKYEGNAVSTTISATLGNGVGDTSITVQSTTGWPSAGPFYVVVDPGTASEEKMLVGSIASTTLSSMTRGVDGTSRVSHAQGAVIYPVFTAVDADEANELTSKYTTRGDLVYQGASTFETLAKGTANHVLKQGANDPAWGYVTNDNVDASAAIALSKLGTGALPTSITVASANLVDGTVAVADLAAVVANALNPTGVVLPYAGTAAPTGWLLCYGQAVSRSTYADLFSILSTTYGTGDGSTTFNVPDLRGRVVAGQDDMGGTSANRLTNPASTTGGIDGDVLGGTGGSETHTLTEAQLAVHTHLQNAHSHSYDGPTGAATYNSSGAGLLSTLSSTTTGSTTATNQNAGSGAAHNNVQPTLILNYIIKT